MLPLYYIPRDAHSFFIRVITCLSTESANNLTFFRICELFFVEPSKGFINCQHDVKNAWAHLLSFSALKVFWKDLWKQQKRWIHPQNYRAPFGSWQTANVVAVDWQNFLKTSEEPFSGENSNFVVNGSFWHSRKNPIYKLIGPFS